VLRPPGEPALIKVIHGIGTVIGQRGRRRSLAGGVHLRDWARGRFCYYYRAVLEGHRPDPKRPHKRYYQDHIDIGRTGWKTFNKQPAKSAAKEGKAVSRWRILVGLALISLPCPRLGIGLGSYYLIQLLGFCAGCRCFCA